MNFFPETPFELRGQFAGFIQNEDGKRRLLLHTESGDITLKVPRELRRELAAQLIPGQAVAVTGVEFRASLFGGVKRLVSHVQSLEANAPLPPVCVICPIEVCAKKNCWKNGGRELWQILERDLAAAGLTKAVPLKAVRCLDECKRAPVVSCDDHLLKDCTAADAAALVARLARRLTPVETTVPPAASAAE